MPLVPSVTELILAEFLYLQYEDTVQPINLYINSAGAAKVKNSFFMLLSYDDHVFIIHMVNTYKIYNLIWTKRAYIGYCKAL